MHQSRTIKINTLMSTVSEDILNGIAEDYEDAKLYAKLRKEQPEGLIPHNMARPLIGPPTL